MLLGYNAPEKLILQCFKTILGTLQLTLKTRISLDILWQIKQKADISFMGMSYGRQGDGTGSVRFL